MTIRQEHGMVLNWRPSVGMRPPYSEMIILTTHACNCHINMTGETFFFFFGETLKIHFCFWFYSPFWLKKLLKNNHWCLKNYWCWLFISRARYKAVPFAQSSRNTNMKEAEPSPGPLGPRRDAQSYGHRLYFPICKSSHWGQGLFV